MGIGKHVRKYMVGSTDEPITTVVLVYSSPSIERLFFLLWAYCI